MLGRRIARVLKEGRRTLVAPAKAARTLVHEINVAVGMLATTIARGHIAGLIAGSAVVSAFANVLIFAHYKLLGFEVLPLLTDPGISIQALQHALVATIAAAVATIIVLALQRAWEKRAARKARKVRKKHLTKQKKKFVRTWRQQTAALHAAALQGNPNPRPRWPWHARLSFAIKRNAKGFWRHITKSPPASPPGPNIWQRIQAGALFQLPPNSDSIVRSARNLAIRLVVTVAIISVLGLTISRALPVWSGPNSNYCNAPKNPFAAPLLPQCKKVTVTMGNAVEGDRSASTIHDVYEIGRFGTVALYISPATGARIALSTNALVMNASEGVVFAPVFSSDDNPNSLRNRLDEMALALGISGETLQCLRQVDKGRLSWVEFRFEENSAEFCVKDNEHTKSAMCARPEASRFAEANLFAMSRLRTIVSSNKGHFDSLMIYGFANSSGSSQGNLKISSDRANSIAAVLEKELSSDDIARLRASGRGEFWRYDKVPALFGLTETTEMGKPAGSPPLEPSEGTSAIVVACALSTPSKPR
jgi:hypothetical protein